MNKGRGFLAALFFISAAFLISSCGGGGGSSATTPAPQTVGINISPATASVTAGKTQQFTATVTGSSNTTVSWAVNGAAGGNTTAGTISSAGLYTAPSQAPNPATVTITATSQADATKSASATVTVMAPVQVTVSISPTTGSLIGGQTLQFNASVTGSSNTAVTWSVSATGNNPAGTITPAGLYNAPNESTQTTVTVTATSQADSTKSASATVTITPVTVAIGPTTASVVLGGTQQFLVTLTGSTNMSVTWSVNGASGGNATMGTVSASGLYTAPSSVPNPSTVTVIATSQADTSKSASASVTITAAPTPLANFSPTSLNFGSVNVSANAMQTVVLKNTGTATLTISGIAVGGTNAGDFSQTNTCGASLASGASCNIVVTFTPSASGSRAASLSVTDNAAGSPQSVALSGTGVVNNLTISPTSATVLLGATQSLALNANATCTSALFGAVPVSGSGSSYAAAYTVPQALPTAWNDTVTCTATVGGSQQTASITLQYPTPTITGTSFNGSLGTIFLFQTSGTSFLVNGTGFLSDGSFNPLNDSQDICGASLVNWGQLQISFAVGLTDFGVQCSQGGPLAIWDPGFLQFTMSDPQNGHGGGTSNVGRIAFLGDQNFLTFNQTDAFLLDSATSTVRKFKTTDGSPDGSFTFSPGTGLAIGIDDVTGNLVLFTGTSFQVFDPATNAKLYEVDAASPGSIHGGAVGKGWAIFSVYDGTEGLPDVLDVFNLQQLGNPPVHLSVKSTPQNFPWYFQLATASGSTVGVVWSIDAGVLSTINLSDLSVIQSLAIPNIYYGTNTSRSGSPDGWQLQVFNSGPLAGTAVLLSQVDNLLVYVNLATMTEIRRVDLTAPFKDANPPQPELQSFRLGKDKVDGSVVVAFADSVNGKTVLYNVDQNGNMSKLNATTPFLATGLQESSDGTQIYWGNRSTFTITPKQ